MAGQNSNNSVRVTDGFLHAVEQDLPWNLTRRLDGKTTKTLPARALWDKIGYAAWASADPGLPVPHHHQRLAHLPGGRADSSVEPMLGIYVSRRYGL